MRPDFNTLTAACVLLAAVASASETSSDRVQQSVRDRLPKFNPAASDAARQAAANKVERPSEQEGVTTLPDFQVVEKKVTQPSADDWLSRAEATRKAVRIAEGKMNILELALNRWHIPLLTPSFAQRARAEYEAQKNAEELDRLNRLSKLRGTP
ncbi:MAG: hypothetical protein Q8J74_10295 [Candidatus Didemnitutus sp.]|nr:hypothetical protein [Candidatus Didemnitutus sp.]